MEPENGKETPEAKPSELDASPDPGLLPEVEKPPEKETKPPSEPEKKPGTVPLTADSVRSIIKDAIQEHAQTLAPDDAPIEPNIAPVPVPDSPSDEDLNRLFSEGKQAEAIRVIQSQFTAGLTRSQARDRRDAALSALESKYGDFYRKWRGTFFKEIEAAKLTDAHLASTAQAERAFRYSLTRNKKALQEFAALDLDKAPDAAPAGAAHDAPAPLPGRTEAPGPAPEPSEPKPGDTVQVEVTADERTVWSKLGVPEEDAKAEKAKIRKAEEVLKTRKDIPGAPYVSMDGVEI